MKTELIHWTDVDMTIGDYNNPRDGEIPHDRHNQERIRYLREYRRDAEMTGVFLCTGEEMAAACQEDYTGPDPCDMGPQPDEIDWTGFPETEEN